MLVNRKHMTQARLPLPVKHASASMMESMAVHDPWVTDESASQSGHRPTKYAAWHIRTSDGESAKSFKPGKHRYVFDQESSTTVFPLFLAATKSAEDDCTSGNPGDEHGTPIYVSSNRRAWRQHISLAMLCFESWLLRATDMVQLSASCATVPTHHHDPFLNSCGVSSQLTTLASRCVLKFFNFRWYNALTATSLAPSTTTPKVFKITWTTTCTT